LVSLDSIQWLLQLDSRLNELAQWMGPWLYVVLFLVIFCETGLVVTPFLPGDSLLFAIGALAATAGSPIRLAWVIPLLIVAAVAGDAVNYAIGKFLGPKVFRWENSWLLNRDHLVHAQRFYATYGTKTIVLARFLPIVRTFAPFVAGIGRMDYFRFWSYNIIGGVTWVVLFLLLGFWFGNLEVVKKNFELVIFAIIGLSVLPMFYEWWQSRRLRGQA
jgi:membrane-associated protein